METIWTVLILLTSAFGQNGRAAFDRLLEGHDNDILTVVKDNAFVCFPDVPDGDRFLTVFVSEVDNDAWVPDSKLNEDSFVVDSHGHTPEIFITQYGGSVIRIWEHEDDSVQVDSGLKGVWTGRGYHKKTQQPPPYFDWVVTDTPGFAFFSGHESAIMQDSTNYSAFKKYHNAAGSNTTWELNIRLSTGRYVEKWTTDDGKEVDSHLGRCSRAKDIDGVTKKMEMEQTR